MKKSRQMPLGKGDIMQTQIPEKDPKLFWTLFWSTFQLSAFTFGGGYVIVPLMRKRFVEGLGWIDENEMIDLIAIAQSSPGPIAVNASIIIGSRIAGISGALCTILGTVLPPLIILSLISLVYTAFRDNEIVSVVMNCMQAGVAAVICDVVITMAQGILKLKKALPIIIMFLAFIGQAVIGINVILIILICGVIGALNYLHETKQQEDRKK